MPFGSQQPGPSRNGDGHTNVQPNVQRTFAQTLQGNNTQRSTSSRNTNTNQFTGITRQHGVQCRFLDGTLIDDYLEATAAIVGAENIVAASKCDGHAKVFVSSPDLANTIVSHGLAVKGKYLEVTPCGISSTNIIISGVPPFLPNEAITNCIRPFGTVVTNVRYIPLGSKKKEFKHVKSFRRQCRIRLHPGMELPYQLLVPHGEDTFTIYFSADAFDRCDFCKKIGHNLRTCRLRRQQAEANISRPSVNVDNTENTLVTPETPENQPATNEANKRAETSTQPAQANDVAKPPQKTQTIVDVAKPQQKTAPTTTKDSSVTAPQKPATEPIASAATSENHEAESDPLDTIWGQTTAPPKQNIMREAGSNPDGFSKPNPKKKAKIQTSGPVTDPPTQNDIVDSNNSTNPLCGNAQIPPTQIAESLSDAETFYTDDEMDISDFSQGSHCLNSTANDINVDAAFTDAQLCDFLKSVKSQRKVFEKAEEFTDDIVGLLNSLRRYRKNTKLTQAEERSVKRVITKLSQH